VSITIDDVLSGIEREHRATKQKYHEASDAAHDLLARATAAGRDRLTDDEERRFQKLLKQRREHSDKIDDLADKLAEARKVALEVDANEKAARETHPTGAGRPAYDPGGACRRRSPHLLPRRPAHRAAELPA
jgi:hypothetical protein